MIGGVDIEIPTPAGQSAIDYCSRVILRLWPHAVFIDGDSGLKFANFGDIPLRGVRELLVYRDSEVEARWAASGAVPELEDTMVHLLSDEGYLTIVVDHPESDEMRQILDVIRTGLTLDSFAVPAQVRMAA